jgi:energy-coupling factor transporter ATP-binding protein EcfA2
MALRLRLEDISYSYPLPGRDEAPALTSISMAVEPGEVLCLAGANGSGKSTLAQVCTGLLIPASGSLYYGDKKVEGRGALREFRRKAGLLFQNPEDQLFADTVSKDIAFGPRNHGVKGEELHKRVRDSAAMVGLPSNPRSWCWTSLSSGSITKGAGASPRRSSATGTSGVLPSSSSHTSCRTYGLWPPGSG